MSIGDFPESLSRAILVGVMLVGRLGVLRARISWFWRGVLTTCCSVRRAHTARVRTTACLHASMHVRFCFCFRQLFLQDVAHERCVS